MSELEKVLAEDLKAAIAAFKEDSFDTTNIMANRMMSNIIFGENKKIFLPAFFLKDVATTFGILKARKSAMAFSTAKSIGFAYIESLAKSLTAIDEEQLWKDFLLFNDKIRKFEMIDVEKNYSDNPKFTHEAFKWLISYLSSHKEALFEPYNNLIKGLLIEMTRIYKVHSANFNDAVLLCLVIALDRNYDYLSRLWNRPGSKPIDEKQNKDLIIPAVNKIIEFNTKEFTIEEADSLLWDLTKSWREFFILYGELLSPSIALQKGIELPEDLKKKLAESLTKALEKETQG
jgi:hypothetical protein